VLLAAALFACKEKTTAPTTSAAPATKAPGSAKTVESVSAASATLVADKADFSRVKERGAVRVIVAGSGESFLPRQGMPASADRDLAIEFATRHSLNIQFVIAAGHDQLLGLLEEGKGDIVAAQLTATKTRSERVAFTRPLFTVSELVVGRKGDANLPRAVADLAGREVHVRKSSSYADTLTELAKKVAVKMVPAEEHLDAEALVYEVSTGKRPLTVVDSHILSAIETYNERAQRLFPIAEARQIAWAVRKDAPELRAAVDAFLVEKALSAHAEKRLTGDLDDLKKRGSLRVLTGNNAVTYFLHKGEQFGFDFELARTFAKQSGLRLEIVVPPTRDLLIPWLLEGRGDVIAAAMTITPERKQKVAFSKPYLYVREVLVQKVGAPKLTALTDLRGKTVHVRRSSSYYETLAELQKKYGPFTVKIEPEDVETEQILRKVGRGEIPYTVSDSHILDVERTYRDDIEAALSLSGTDAAASRAGGDKEIAFAVRPGNPVLKAKLDEFVGKTYRGIAYNMARARYFKNKHRIAQAKESQGDAQGNISPFDEIIKRFTAKYDLDWRLMAAQAYQESRFNPNARSWAGALGLFQLMPPTAKALGFDNLVIPEQGVQAGIEHLFRTIGQIDPKIPLKHRLRFALAAYNAGLGHVLDARRLAEEMGLNPNKWFGHVEKAMLLLEKPAYYSKARYGYCRGTEPVKYVSEIQNRYDNYIKVVKK
jgi:membrane-bound lytic murein transglycosylase F